MRHNRYSIFVRSPVKIFGGMVLWVLGVCIGLPVSADVQNIDGTVVVSTVSESPVDAANQPATEPSTGGGISDSNALTQPPVAEHILLPQEAGEPNQPILKSPEAAAEPNQPVLIISPQAAVETNQPITDKAAAISSTVKSEDTAGTQEQKENAGLPVAATVPQQAVNREGLYFILILSVVVLAAGLVIIFLAAWRRKV